MRAFFMEMPKEMFDADESERQKANDAIMGPIMQGRHAEKEGDNRYVPKHTPIKFEEGPLK